MKYIYFRKFEARDLTIQFKLQKQFFTQTQLEMVLDLVNKTTEKLDWKLQDEYIKLVISNLKEKDENWITRNKLDGILHYVNRKTWDAPNFDDTQQKIVENIKKTFTDKYYSF